MNWILDADIRSFFDTVSHDWLLRFLEQRIGDRRVLRLIRKWLTVGVLENGVRTPARMGTPQGAVISPLLANVYLHYVLDLWVTEWRQRHARGEVIVVRYADDTVMGFEHRTEAVRFLADLEARMAEYALALHPDKTRLIEFGRVAAANREARGLGKPETFDFPRLHPHLRAHPQGAFPGPAAFAPRPDAGQASVHQGGAAAADACTRC